MPRAPRRRIDVPEIALFSLSEIDSAGKDNNRRVYMERDPDIHMSSLFTSKLNTKRVKHFAEKSWH